MARAYQASTLSSNGLPNDDSEDGHTETRSTLGLLQTPVSDPSERGHTRPHDLPYLFGMVKNSGPSHKCVSEAQAVRERMSDHAL